MCGWAGSGQVHESWRDAPGRTETPIGLIEMESTKRQGKSAFTLSTCADEKIKHLSVRYSSSGKEEEEEEEETMAVVGEEEVKKCI